MLATPQRRAGLRLRVHKRTLIEKLDEIFREKNVQRPIDGYAHFLFGAWQFAPIFQTNGCTSATQPLENSCGAREMGSALALIPSVFRPTAKFFPSGSEWSNTGRIRFARAVTG